MLTNVFKILVNKLKINFLIGMNKIILFFLCFLMIFILDIFFYFSFFVIIFIMMRILNSLKENLTNN